MDITKIVTGTGPKLVLRVAAGALLGYLFYYFYGCNGTCLISSNPWNSTLYGAFVGLLMSRSLFTKKNQQQ